MEPKDLKRKIERRVKVSSDAAKETSILVRALQAVAFAKAIEFAGRLVVGDNGKWKDNINNTNTAIAVGSFFNRWLSVQFSDLIRIIVGKIKDVVGAGGEFYSDTAGAPESIEDKAKNLILRRLGFDINKDELIVGGWLDGLVKDHGLGRELGRQLGDAIGQGMTPEEFTKKFRKVFVNPNGIGYLDRYFSTFTHDFYMQIDRATANLYRQELGFTNAIWSGTVIAESRPLCEKNTNKVFSEKELLDMQETEFQGKKPNHNIFVDCGGYNCRHVLSWVSDMTAEAIKRGDF
jgi:hypothetical protein